VVGAEGSYIEMEGKGMLMYNRVTGEPSHTMWVMKPVIPRRWSIIDVSLTPHADKKPGYLDHSSSIQQPDLASEIEFPPDVQNEPITAEEHRAMMRNRSKSEPAIHTPPFLPAAIKLDDTDECKDVEGIPVSLTSLMSLPPVLCRVCERWVVAAFFEQHSELCVEIHQSEMDVNGCNDSLLELKHIINERIENAKNEIGQLEADDLNKTTTNQDSDVVIETAKAPDEEEEDDDNDSIFGDCLPLEDALHPL
jgi:serine/threonine-protein kinase RIM15